MILEITTKMKKISRRLSKYRIKHRGHKQKIEKQKTFQTRLEVPLKGSCLQPTGQSGEEHYTRAASCK